MLDHAHRSVGFLLALSALQVANAYITCVWPTATTLTAYNCDDECGPDSFCVNYNNDSASDCTDSRCFPHAPDCNYRQLCMAYDDWWSVSMMKYKIHYVDISNYHNVTQVKFRGGTDEDTRGNYYNVSLNDVVFNTPDALYLFYVGSIDLGGSRLDRVVMGSTWRNVTFRNTNLDKVPTQFQAMKNMVYLNIGFNNLKDFPDYGWPSMAYLIADHNPLPTIPDSIFAMKKLKILYMGGCGIKNVHLTDERAKFIKQLDHLWADFTVTECRNGFKKETWTIPCGDCTTKTNAVDFCVDTGSNWNSSSANGTSNDTQDPSHEQNQPQGSQQQVLATGSKKGFFQRSWWMIVVVVAVVVAVLGFVVWKRRRQHDKGFDTSSKGGSTQELSNPFALMTETDDVHDIWSDPALLEVRIDYDAVTLSEVIANGNFGEVWLGTFRNRQVVIKQMRNDKRSAQYVNAFVDEIKMIATLDHPKIVSLVGAAWYSTKTLLAVSEYMDGGDLCSFLASSLSETCTWSESKSSIALDVAEGLVYLHSLDPKIIHRDLKSRNIMLDHDLNAKLTDFGISRQEDREHTMTACTGTARWMAPEVIVGSHYSEAADIYSFGVVLTELDTRKLPFDGVKNERGDAMDDVELLQLVAAGELQPSFSAECPPSILQLGSQCLNFDPKSRPTSMQVSYALRQAKVLLTF